jgi:hypothetical protein
MELTPQEEAERDAFFAENKDQIQEIFAGRQGERADVSPARRWKDRLAATGSCLLYLAFMAIPILVLTAIFKKIDWLIAYGYPVCEVVSVAALFVVVPISLVLAIFRKTREWGALGILLASYAFGFATWLWALMLAFVGAGIVWVVLGLCFYGVGVVGVAIVAWAIHGEWGVVAQLVVAVIVVYALRAFALFLTNRHEASQD